jgi:hypothetical protein
MNLALSMLGILMFTGVEAVVVFACYFGLKFTYHRILVREMRKESFHG